MDFQFGAYMNTSTTEETSWFESISWSRQLLWDMKNQLHEITESEWREEPQKLWDSASVFITNNGNYKLSDVVSVAQVDVRCLLLLFDGHSSLLLRTLYKSRFVRELLNNIANPGEYVTGDFHTRTRDNWKRNKTASQNHEYQ